MYYVVELKMEEYEEMPHNVVAFLTGVTNVEGWGHKIVDDIEQDIPPKVLEWWDDNIIAMSNDGPFSDICTTVGPNIEFYFDERMPLFVEENLRQRVRLFNIWSSKGFIRGASISIREIIDIPLYAII